MFEAIKNHLGNRIGKLVSVRPSGKCKNRVQPTIECLEDRALPTATAIVPPALAVPIYNSHPGAQTTIYLDFDGHTENGWSNQDYPTLRNVIIPAFDTDGNPNTFSESERDAIRKIWQRVADLYEPFNVNVTTDPKGLDFVDRKCLRVVIGGTCQDVLGKGVPTTNSSGISNIGSFTNSSAANVAFAFSQSIDDLTKIKFKADGHILDKDHFEVYVGNTAAHEAAHCIGLKHQSQFAATGVFEGNHPNSDGPPEYSDGGPGWAPIMGNNLSSEQLTWFSGQNLEGVWQDDRALLGSRLGFRTDGATQIADKATFLRADGITLGNALTGITSTGDGKGLYQNFQFGSIYWSPFSGAHLIRNGILKKWQEQGGVKGYGYPTTDELKTPDGKGLFNNFESVFGNAIYWSNDASKAYTIEGGILQKWLGMGGVKSYLGYPTSDITKDSSGGYYSEFGTNRRLVSAVWSQPTAVHEIEGAILAKWLSMKGGASYLGYPTSDMMSDGHGGYYNDFGTNRRLLWGPATAYSGAHEIEGAILVKWNNMNGGGSYLSYPTSDMLSDGHGGFYNELGSNRRLVWGPATASSGAHEIEGAILLKWLDMKGGASYLSYPTSDMLTDSTGGYYNIFQNGRIYWSGQTNVAVDLNGAILDKWLALGGGRSAFGYPTAAATSTTKYVILTPATGGNKPQGAWVSAIVVRFQHGSIYYVPGTVGHGVYLY